MDHNQEQQQLSPSLTLLSRLDRLDRLLLLLEERQCLSTRHASSPSVMMIKKMKTDDEDDQCKTLSSALEEVNHKGTLMERLTTLENRVLEMEIGNTSRSSSSSIKMAENFERKSTSSAVPGQDDEHIINSFQLNPTLVEACACEEKSKGCHKDRRGRRSTGTLLRSKKWFGWFRMGC